MQSQVTGKWPIWKMLHLDVKTLKKGQEFQNSYGYFFVKHKISLHFVWSSLALQ